MKKSIYPNIFRIRVLIFASLYASIASVPTANGWYTSVRTLEGWYFCTNRTPNYNYNIWIWGQIMKNKSMYVWITLETS